MRRRGKTSRKTIILSSGSPPRTSASGRTWGLHSGRCAMGDGRRAAVTARGPMDATRPPAHAAAKGKATVGSEKARDGFRLAVVCALLHAPRPMEVKVKSKPKSARARNVVVFRLEVLRQDGGIEASDAQPQRRAQRRRSAKYSSIARKLLRLLHGWRFKTAAQRCSSIGSSRPAIGLRSRDRPVTRARATTRRRRRARVERRARFGQSLYSSNKGLIQYQLQAVLTVRVRQ
ncbi:hypothetical protein K438DRAFT_1781022 [Mycena galopus ATCC 62051]|nr:hypothetical protein K438DRAFT_1781022 [Mycena galopus ATCC 62051]